MRILIVDDDPKYRTFVAKGLTESGMECVVAESGERALALLRRDKFDLVLLDVMLPELQGWDVLEAARREGIDVPVIFVTARDAVSERVRGLKAGGDDYIVKPFAFAELVARIHTVLRRRRVLPKKSVGDLVIDYVETKVTRGGTTIDLTRIEFSLLRCLAQHEGKPTSRTELLQQVWGLDFDPGTNVVEVHIRRLRKKIDDPFPYPLVQTVRGSGYALARTE